MGLDISIATDKDEVLYDSDYFLSEESYNHKLSRTFCNFMSRRNVIGTEPELDQLGRLTNIDVTPLYDMESYPNTEAIDFQLMTAESDEDKEKILKEAEEFRTRLNGNIDRVLALVDNFVAKLNDVDQLPAKIATSDFDTLDNVQYFSDFQIDKGDGYIGNNLGQDLRNFQRFLNFAKSKGVTTVYFVYG
jgi:hypothetical protein